MQKLAEKAQSKALCRQLQKLSDSEDSVANLTPEGQEWVKKYLGTSANAVKKHMREVWMHCNMDLDQAGMVMRAERTAYKDDHNVGEWLNEDHLRYIYIYTYTYLYIT